MNKNHDKMNHCVKESPRRTNIVQAETTTAKMKGHLGYHQYAEESIGTMVEENIGRVVKEDER